MKLKYVTFTGADDKTDVDSLIEFAAQHSNVEIAILFSQSKAGVARYPSEAWVKRLYEANQSAPDVLNFSAHLCGKWVEDFFKGNFVFFEADYTTMFDRFQLNMGKERLAKAFSSRTLLEACEEAPVPVIWGGDYFVYNGDKPIMRYDLNWFAEHENIHPLFDASGGRGVTSNTYPTVSNGIFYGFAGGLSPDNIEAELVKMNQVVGDKEIWIDMESKVRHKDVFDLGLCEQVMQTIERGDWSK